MRVILYRGEDADLTLPIRLLKDQTIRWEVKDGLPEPMERYGAKLHPREGWYAFFPAYGLGANRWTGIYEILHTRGLLL